MTLTEEAQALVERAMRERGASFKDIVNEAIVMALQPLAPRKRFVQKTVDLGGPSPSIEEMKRLDEQEEIEKYERIARGLGGIGVFD